MVNLEDGKENKKEKKKKRKAEKKERKRNGMKMTRQEDGQKKKKKKKKTDGRKDGMEGRESGPCSMVDRQTGSQEEEGPEERTGQAGWTYSCIVGRHCNSAWCYYGDPLVTGRNRDLPPHLFVPHTRDVSSQCGGGRRRRRKREKAVPDQGSPLIPSGDLTPKLQTGQDP